MRYYYKKRKQEDLIAGFLIGIILIALVVFIGVIGNAGQVCRENGYQSSPEIIDFKMYCVEKPENDPAYTRYKEVVIDEK